MGELTCCYIADQEAARLAVTHEEVAVISCPKPAEWLLVDGPGPDDYTHACTEHVGALLSDAAETWIYPVGL